MKNVLIPLVGLLTVRLPQMMMQNVSLSLCRSSKGKRVKPAIVTESGFNFLLESGGRILLERGGTRLFPPRLPKTYPTFLLENGHRLLQEDGFKIQLETND